MRSARRSLCATILCLEAIALGLATPVLIVVASVPVATGLSLGLGVAVLCVVLAGLLRAEWAYYLGWLVQLVAIGLGFVVGIMFVVGVVFAVLWGAADWLGRKIERERAEAWAAYEGVQVSEPEPG